MIVKEKNQNYIMNQDLINSFEIDYIFENKPINRFKSKPTIEITNSKLNDLQVKIKNISNCELKNNAKQIVFSDGNFKNSIMIVGEGPGQKEDELGKPFVGDAGQLLNKMIAADWARLIATFKRLRLKKNDLWQGTVPCCFSLTPNEGLSDLFIRSKLQL